jgi:hypothetical protein
VRVTLITRLQSGPGGMRRPQDIPAAR